MKSIAVAALLGHIAAEEITIDISAVPVAEDDTLFNPVEETLEDLNKPEPTDPCCHACSEPLEKYYSVDHLHNNCGEACMDPKLFWLYKLFEPGLAKDETTNEPCQVRGYDDYQYTPTHGAGPIKMTLDLYGPHKNELEQLNDVETDCEAHSEGECHSDSACSWCKSAAVKSTCRSVDMAKTLPSAVFQCDNLGLGDQQETCRNYDQDGCHSDDNCSWCTSAAVASACNSVDTAKSLPSAVF